MGTLICAPIMVHDVAQALELADAARSLAADLVEFRVDELFSGDPADEDKILDLVRRSPLPCIVTCRPTWEGGACDADDDARVALFERLGTSDHPPRYIDFELAAYTRSPNLRQKIDLAVEHPRQVRDVKTSLILSTHDFIARPSDLTRRVLSMGAQEAASVHKIAFRARSLRDNLELFDILSERSKPTIALGMGEFGLMSRVLAPKFGAFLTFASVRPLEVTAPGQPTIRELLDLYRFRSIGPETLVYGVVGWPVGHSLSPLIHNAGFEAVGHDAVYLPLPIAVGEKKAEENGDGRDAHTTGGGGGYESFKATMLALVDHAALDLAGVSVTIPHKENLVRLAREQSWVIDELSEACGAGNTLAVSRGSGRLKALVTNTDAPAAASCLEDAIGDLAGKRIAILGAGGVARAIAMGVSARGADVLVVNRTRERAEALCAALAPPTLAKGVASAIEPDDLVGASPDAIVNATPVGMTGGPAPSESPLTESVLEALPKSAVVFDTVYNPVRTPLLTLAERHGLRTIDGVAMFVRQAAMQFETWTGKTAPTQLFDRILREKLGSAPS
ncbi:MAG: type I 3-dehydroquinate dehydratase [Phycisphaerales bacterium]